MLKRWLYKEDEAPEASPQLIEAADNVPLLAKLLAIRGITDPTLAREFLNLEGYQPTSPQAFPDMDKAVERIIKAIELEQPVLVYGDFDVDGITGTSLLYQCLKQLTAKVSYYIPSRHTEGHGLNTASVCRLVSSRQIKVLITTDTGSSNFNEVNLLNGLGVDTIITDHHELPEHLPKAIAILNPKLLDLKSPLAHLAGVGVAYMLCDALYEALGYPETAKKALLDLVAIGTVVDMVPLVRENRYLVWRGVQAMQGPKRLGIQALLEVAGLDPNAPVTSQTLGFVLGPRLNAIGRLSTAEDAVELLTTSDKEQATVLAAKLEQLNRRRKEMVEESLIQADTHLVSTGELNDQKAIILCSTDWNQGIVGLVASKLIERYHRPCFMGYIDEESQEIRFSARSIPGFNLHQNLLGLEDLFLRWGGHSGAAGFVIQQKDLPKLKQRLFQVCHAVITDEQLLPITQVDLRVSPEQVNPALLDIIEKMAPFGQENPYPIFALDNIKLGAQRLMGDDKQHLKLILAGKKSGDHLEAVFWNWGHQARKLNPESKFRLAFTADLNTYNGVTKLQIVLKDIQDVNQSVETVLQSAQVSPLRTVMAQPLPPESPEKSLSPAVRWVDHRSRDQIESFLPIILGGDLSQITPAECGIFSEGTQSGFPLPLPETFFWSRRQPAHTAVSTQQLLFWDLPPDLYTLNHTITTLCPTTIHLVGGKYQKMPLSRPPREFIEGFYKVLLKLRQQFSVDTENMTVTQVVLAATLSTSESVVLPGLSLLAKLGMIQARKQPGSEALQVQFLAMPQNPFGGIEEHLEYAAFAQALKEVYQFRQWLMTAPLSVIQSSTVDPHAVGLSSQVTSSPQLPEREPHAVHL